MRRRSRRTSGGFRAFATVGILAAIAASVAFVLRYLGILDLPLPQIFEQRATYSASLPDSSLTYTNPYDWSHLSVGSNGRYHYTMGGQEVSRTGVDVSEHQGSIDWKAVKADGIGFAYIRVGYRGSDTGVIIGDAQFKANIQGAQAAGLQMGAYFYSEAISVEEARAEAQYVLGELGSTPLDYPIAFDYEPTGNDRDRIAGLSNDQMAAIAQAFCDAIQEGGRSAIVYGNASDLARMNAPTLYQYGFWYASYTTLPSATVAFGIWQYSSQGSVAGINTLVDMDMDVTQPLATYLQKQNG